MNNRYAVHMKQAGYGCDYTIACGQKFVLLPESIQSMEEAEQYVLNEEEEGCVSYHSDELEAVTIYEIIASKELSLDNDHA